MVICAFTKLPGRHTELAEGGVFHTHPPFLYCSKDKAQPETQATSFGNVLFNAKLAEDDPEAVLLVNQPGSDGFKVDSTPLFQVGQRQAHLLWDRTQVTQRLNASGGSAAHGRVR